MPTRACWNSCLQLYRATLGIELHRATTSTEALGPNAINKISGNAAQFPEAGAQVGPAKQTDITEG